MPNLSKFIKEVSPPATLHKRRKKGVLLALGDILKNKFKSLDFKNMRAKVIIVLVKTKKDEKKFTTQIQPLNETYRNLKLFPDVFPATVRVLDLQCTRFFAMLAQSVAECP